MPEDQPGFVLLDRAPNAAIAGLWQSMLEAAGIPSYVPGTQLADEWAASQRVMGNIGADVFVPQTQLEQAREIIAPSDSPEPEPDLSETEDPTEKERPSDQRPADNPADLAQSLTRRQLLFELVAVCAVVVVPDYVAAVYGLVSEGFPRVYLGSPPYERLWRLAQWVPMIVLLRWVISRSGQSPSTFGLVRLRPVRDVLAAILILFVTGIALTTLSSMYGSLPRVNEASDRLRFMLGLQTERRIMPGSVGEWTALVTVTIAGAFLEELAIRGYLLVRLRMLLESPIKAAVISSLVFAGYHVYQGVLPLAGHFVVGLVFAWAFFKLKSLWPLVMAHAAHNLLLDVTRAS